MSSASVLVLSADRWSMTDEKTGKPMGGVSIWFVNDYREDTEDGLGFKPTKVGAPADLWPALRATKFPAVCELVSTFKPGAGGKASVVISGVKVLRELPELFSAASTGSKK
jgi:hypothetical protein